MQLTLEEIEIADIQILSTEIDMSIPSITIILPQCYYIPGKQLLGKTQMLISNWSKFTNIKNIFHQDTGEIEELVITELSNVQSFNLIQQVRCNNNFLVFSGWSSGNADWMSYEFYDGTLNITVV